jgi:glutaredoxin
MMAKGGLGGVSEYGLITVLERYPFLKRVHQYALDTYIDKNDVTSIKFIVHTGQQGMKDDAIILYEDHNEDDPYDYIDSENHTAAHQDYMCHRHGDNGELILGCGSTVKEYKSNTTAQQQNRGRNATLIMNLGHDRTLQIRSCVDDDHELANITMNHHLAHGDVIAFGTQLNAVATHTVLGGSTGNRISLVYELALHDPVWMGDETTTFHEHMGVNEGKLRVRPLRQTIKVEQECSSNIPSSTTHMLSYSSLSKQHSGMPSTVWDTRRKELAKYKQQNNGSTNVPRPFSSNIPLGNWVKTQRYQYKLLQEEKNSSMTTERIKSLNELDFEWNLNSTPWEEHLQELTIYKQANESTNVPRLFPSNIPLGQWVGTQRTQYRLFNLNEKSSMTTERIKSLNELDFEWSPGKETSALWEQRLQELTIYKQKNNGSTNVPQHRPATKLLGQWVQRHRYQYRLFNLNEKSSMTTERIKSLNELDFEWSPGNKKESKRSKKRK